jgi:hypothetical protein
MQPDSRVWDPGEDPSTRNKLVKISVSSVEFSMLYGAIASDVDVTTGDTEESRTELDSHANMPVVGRNAYIISDTGRIAEVNAFTPE